MKKAVQFGAGKIGRGFIAQLLIQSGYEVVFVDINSKVVSLLNKRKSYTIKIVGTHPQELKIKNIRAVSNTEVETIASEVSDADIVFTAVGGDNLKSIAPIIAKGLKQRIDNKKMESLNIILCENLINASETLKSYVIENIGVRYRDYVESKVGFVAAIVSRMVPDIPERLKDIDPLMVLTEEYDKLPIDKEAFLGETPGIKGIVPVDNFGAYVERKLFIHNAGHSLAAYLGYKMGYTYIYETIDDQNILKIVTGALRESSQALIKKHGFEPEAQEEYIKDIMQRFNNKALEDTVVRGARNPIRKLSFNDRLIGAAMMAIEYEIVPENLALGVAAAFGYDYEEDPKATELQQLLKSEGIDAVLIKICGLQPSSKLFFLIKRKVTEITNHLPLDELLTGLEIVEKGEGLKVVIEP